MKMQQELMEAICDMFGDYYGAGLDVPFEDEGSGKLTHVGGMCKLENGVFWQNVNIRYNVTAVYEVMMENIGKCLKSHGFELTEAQLLLPALQIQTPRKYRHCWKSAAAVWEWN